MQERSFDRFERDCKQHFVVERGGTKVPFSMEYDSADGYSYDVDEIEGICMLRTLNQLVEAWVSRLSHGCSHIWQGAHGVAG